MMSSEMEDGGVGIVLNAQPRRQSSATMELNRQPGPDYEPKHHEPLSSSSFASIDFASKSELGSPKAAIAGGTAHSSSVKAKLSALKTQQRSASSTTSNSPLVKKRLQWNNDLAATKTIIDAGDDSEDYEDGRLRMAKDNDDDADSDTEYAYQSKYQELMHSMGCK
jgi:hypothetical protein